MAMSSAECGYDCDFTITPSDHLICRICLHVLRDPHLTSCCGHHFCYSCINKSYQRSKLCPLCQNTFTVFQAQNIIREVNALQVRCRNKAAGCEWVGPLKQLEEHVSNCGFVNVLCNQGCGQYVHKRLLQKHCDLLCPFRSYECQFCNGYASTYQDVESNHWKVCEHFPVPCPNDCPNGSIARGRLMDHLKKECKIKQQLAEMRFLNSQLTEEVEEMQQRIRQLEEKIRLQERGRIRQGTWRQPKMKPALLNGHLELEEEIKPELDGMRSNNYNGGPKRHSVSLPYTNRVLPRQIRHGSPHLLGDWEFNEADGIPSQGRWFSDPVRRFPRQSSASESFHRTISEHHNGAVGRKLADSGVAVDWRQCQDLPEVMYDGNAVLVDNIVYAGGGTCQRTGTYDNECTVFAYNHNHDAWFSLSPTNRHKFTLMSYQNQLVLVGGAVPGKKEYLNTLIVWEGSTLQWIEPYHPMHTQRMQASAIGHGQYIAVAGGKNKVELDSVEVYDVNKYQWHFVTRLPAKIFQASSTFCNGDWYLMGGHGQKRAVYYTSIDSLIREESQARSEETWQTLPDTDFPLATIATIDDRILAIGGAKKFGVTNTVRVYSATVNAWLPVEKPLPIPFHSAAAVVLPPEELLLIGGCADFARYKHVFRGSFK